MLYVGSSNFAGWHIVQANEAAKRRGSLGLVSEQSLYNLNARMVELEVLPACQAYGVGVIPWSPLGGGLLGGALRKVTEGRRGERARADAGRATTATSSRRGSRCAASSARSLPTWRWRGCSTSRRSPLRSSGPARPTSSPARYRALEITLEHDTLDALDKIFPGPGGAAPEAYAW